MNEPAPSAKREPTPFERMQALATQVMSVPKEEIDRREQQWRKDRDAKKRRGGR